MMELLLEQGWGSYCCKRSEERGLVCANQAVAELLWDRPKDQEAKVQQLNVKITLQKMVLGTISSFLFQHQTGFVAILKC